MFYIYFVELPVFFRKIEAPKLVNESETMEEPDENHEVSVCGVDINDICEYHKTVSGKYVWVQTHGSRCWLVNMKYDVFKQFLNNHIETYNNLNKESRERPQSNRNGNRDILRNPIIDKHLTYNDIPDEDR